MVESPAVLLLAQVAVILGLAGSFVLGLVLPHRRHLSAVFALIAYFLCLDQFSGDVRDAQLLAFVGWPAAVLVFQMASDLGLATRLLLTKFGITSRRRRVGRFKRPDRDDDRIALLGGVLLYCLPLQVWWFDSRPRALLVSTLLGLIYGTWSLRIWRRLRPSCLRLRERRKRPRTVTHRCVGCGYDLTGNESGRCPECGKKIERALRGRLVAKDAVTGQPTRRRTAPVE